MIIETTGERSEVTQNLTTSRVNNYQVARHKHTSNSTKEVLNSSIHNLTDGPVAIILLPKESDRGYRK